MAPAMKLPLAALSVIALLAIASPAGAAPPSSGDKWFAGGGLALSFGAVDFVSISPIIGYRFTPVVSAGLGLQYIYRSDDRYGQNYSTSDYGGHLFTRFHVGHGAFLSAAYEVLRFQYFDPAGNTLTDDYDSFFVGGGFARPISRHSAFIVSAMYNLTYETNEPSPYDSPWVIGAGVSVGF